MPAQSKPKTNQTNQRQNPAITKSPPGMPEDVAEFIGRRPIVQGEEPRHYDALLAKLVALVVPEDTIEWIWVKDVADAHWESRRARRFRDEILDLGRFKAMKRVVENLLQDKRSGPNFNALVASTVSSWMGPDGDSKMEKFLARYDLDPSAIAAEVFMARSEPYDQLERMAAAADKRRDAVFREIERRRAWRAEQFRDAAKIVDAEAEEVTGKDRKGATASGLSNDKR